MTEYKDNGLRTTLINNVVSARYESHSKVAIEKYFDTFGEGAEAITQLATAVKESIANPLPWTGYTVPARILENNALVRKEVWSLIGDLGEKPPIGDAIDNLRFTLTLNHVSIKQAQNRWLIASASTMLEAQTVPASIDPAFRTWLDEKYDVRPGDKVLHRHAIDHNGMTQLRIANVRKNLSINPSYNHWGPMDIHAGLETATEIIASNPDCKGILGEGSWLYAPENFERASDGRPYASFIGLKEYWAAGDRFHIGPAEKGMPQYYFAIQNRRRLNFVVAGEFKPQVYGTFYPREELFKRFLPYL